MIKSSISPKGARFFASSRNRTCNGASETPLLSLTVSNTPLPWNAVSLSNGDMACASPVILRKTQPSFDPSGGLRVSHFASAILPALAFTSMGPDPESTIVTGFGAVGKSTVRQGPTPARISTFSKMESRKRNGPEPLQGRPAGSIRGQFAEVVPTPNVRTFT